MYNTLLHKRILIRLIAIITVVCYLATSAPAYGFSRQTLFKEKSHAQRHIKDEEKKRISLVSDPFSLSVPKNSGRIIETHKGNANKLVIHIQDKHADSVAQFNIAGIIDTLAEKHNLHLVCLEGGTKELDASFYNKFPDSGIKTKVSEAFIKTALFTGPEFYKITHKDKYIKLFGVENKRYYLQHLDSYEKNQFDKDKVIALIRAIKSDLDKLKDKAYTKDLLKIDKAGSDYNQEIIALSEYIGILGKYFNKTGLDISKHKNLGQFLELVKKEQDIDFAKAKEQREALIKHLSEILPEKELKALLRRSVEFKLGKITDEEFYAYLRSVIARSDSDEAISTSYPDLFAYIGYLKLSKTISHLELFDEAELAYDELTTALAKDNTQLRLAGFLKAARLLFDLYNLKLTSKHLDYINYNVEYTDITSIKAFLKETLPRYGLSVNPYILSNNISRQSINNAGEFYQLALKRDIALVDNTLKRMKKTGSVQSVLVTGGFHTDGITNILRQKDISYIVICPNVSLRDCEELYNRRVHGALPSPDDIIAVIQNTLSLPLASGEKSTQALFEETLELLEKIGYTADVKLTEKPTPAPSEETGPPPAEEAHIVTPQEEPEARPIDVIVQCIALPPSWVPIPLRRTWVALERCIIRALSFFGVSDLRLMHYAGVTFKRRAEATSETVVRKYEHQREPLGLSTDASVQQRLDLIARIRKDKDTEWMPLLYHLFSDDNGWVRRDAIEAFGELGESVGLENISGLNMPGLRKILESIWESDEDLKAKNAAIDLLIKVETALARKKIEKHKGPPKDRGSGTTRRQFLKSLILIPAAGYVATKAFDAFALTARDIEITKAEMALVKEFLRKRPEVIKTYIKISDITHIKAKYLMALELAETDGKDDAVSEVGARGPMQVTRHGFNVLKKYIQKREGEKRKGTISHYDLERYNFVKKLAGNEPLSWEKVKSKQHADYNRRLGSAIFAIDTWYFHDQKLVRRGAEWKLVRRKEGESWGFYVTQAPIASHNIGRDDVVRALEKYGGDNWLKGFPKETRDHNERFLKRLRAINQIAYLASHEDITFPLREKPRLAKRATEEQPVTVAAVEPARAISRKASSITSPKPLDLRKTASIGAAVILPLWIGIIATILRLAEKTKGAVYSAAPARMSRRSMFSKVLPSVMLVLTMPFIIGAKGSALPFIGVAVFMAAFVIACWYFIVERPTMRESGTAIKHNKIRILVVSLVALAVSTVISFFVTKPLEGYLWDLHREGQVIFSEEWAGRRSPGLIFIDSVNSMFINTKEVTEEELRNVLDPEAYIEQKQLSTKAKQMLKAKEALEIIEENQSTIKKYAEGNNINPSFLAAILLVEKIDMFTKSAFANTEKDLTEEHTDWMGALLEANTSVGLAQINIETFKELFKGQAWQQLGGKKTEDLRGYEIANLLRDTEVSIMASAKYLGQLREELLYKGILFHDHMLDLKIAAAYTSSYRGEEGEVLQEPPFDIEEFDDMLSRRDPQAHLVTASIYAHWVKKAEKYIYMLGLFRTTASPAPSVPLTPPAPGSGTPTPFLLLGLLGIKIEPVGGLYKLSGFGHKGKDPRKPKEKEKEQAPGPGEDTVEISPEAHQTQKEQEEQPPSQIGKKARDVILTVWRRKLTIVDSKGKQHSIALTPQGKLDIAYLKLQFENMADLDQKYRKPILEILSLLEDSPPDIFTFNELVEDTFARAFPERRTIVIYEELFTNPTALFHEAAEYLKESHPEIIREMEGLLDDAGIKWVNEKQRRHGNRPHYIIRAFTWQAFGQMDEELTEKIKREQKSQGEKEFITSMEVIEDRVEDAKEAVNNLKTEDAYRELSQLETGVIETFCTLAEAYGSFAPSSEHKDSYIDTLISLAMAFPSKAKGEGIVGLAEEELTRLFVGDAAFNTGARHISPKDQRTMWQKLSTYEIPINEDNAIRRLSLGIPVVVKPQEDLTKIEQFQREAGNTKLSLSIIWPPVGVPHPLVVISISKDFGFVAVPKFATSAFCIGYTQLLSENTHLAVSCREAIAISAENAEVDAFELTFSQGGDRNLAGFFPPTPAWSSETGDQEIITEQLRKFGLLASPRSVGKDPSPQIGRKARKVILTFTRRILKITDSKGIEHRRNLTRKGKLKVAPLKTQLEKTFEKIQDANPEHKELIFKALGLVEDSPPDVRTFSKLVEGDDTFGRAFPDRNTIVIYEGLFDDPIALFHEVAEYVKTHPSGIIEEMEGFLDDAGIEWVDEKERKHGNRPHYIIRAFTWQVFGEADEGLTEKIKKEQEDQEETESAGLTRSNIENGKDFSFLIWQMQQIIDDVNKTIDRSNKELLEISALTMLGKLIKAYDSFVPKPPLKYKQAYIRVLISLIMAFPAYPRKECLSHCAEIALFKNVAGAIDYNTARLPEWRQELIWKELASRATSIDIPRLKKLNLGIPIVVRGLKNLEKIKRLQEAAKNTRLCFAVINPEKASYPIIVIYKELMPIQKILFDDFASYRGRTQEFIRVVGSGGMGRSSIRLYARDREMNSFVLIFGSGQDVELACFTKGSERPGDRFRGKDQVTRKLQEIGILAPTPIEDYYVGSPSAARGKYVDPDAALEKIKAEVDKRREAKPDKPVLILLDGEGTAGKSQLARAIAGDSSTVFDSSKWKNLGLDDLKQDIVRIGGDKFRRLFNLQMRKAKAKISGTTEPGLDIRLPVWADMMPYKILADDLEWFRDRIERNIGAGYYKYLWHYVERLFSGLAQQHNARDRIVLFDEAASYDYFSKEALQHNAPEETLVIHVNLKRDGDERKMSVKKLIWRADKPYDRFGFGFTSFKMLAQAAGYKKDLLGLFANCGLSTKEKEALADSLARAREGTLRSRGELFSKSETDAILINYERLDVADYEMFDVAELAARFKKEKQKYEDKKDLKGEPVFSKEQIHTLLFKKLIPLSWFEELSADGLSKTDTIQVLTRWVRPRETWRGSLKPIRDRFLEDGLIISEANWLVTRRADAEKAWQEELKSVHDGLIAMGLSRSKAGRIIARDPDPRAKLEALKAVNREEFLTSVLNNPYINMIDVRRRRRESNEFPFSIDSALLFNWDVEPVQEAINETMTLSKQEIMESALAQLEEFNSKEVNRYMPKVHTIGEFVSIDTAGEYDMHQLWRAKTARVDYYYQKRIKEPHLIEQNSEEIFSAIKDALIFLSAIAFSYIDSEFAKVIDEKILPDREDPYGGNFGYLSPNVYTLAIYESALTMADKQRLKTLADMKAKDGHKFMIITIPEEGQESIIDKMGIRAENVTTLDEFIDKIDGLKSMDRIEREIEKLKALKQTVQQNNNNAAMGVICGPGYKEDGLEAIAKGVLSEELAAGENRRMNKRVGFFITSPGAVKNPASFEALLAYTLCRLNSYNRSENNGINIEDIIKVLPPVTPVNYQDALKQIELIIETIDAQA